MTSDLRRPPGWHKRLAPSRRIVFGAVALLCVIATGAALAAFASPGGEHAATGNASAALGAVRPAASAASAASAAPAANAGTRGDGSNGVAKTALRWAPSEQGQIARWKAGSGGTALSAVTTELGTAAQTAAVKLYPDTRQACGRLGSGVETALAASPIPDAAIQRAYATSLATLARAAKDCRGAISVHQEGDEDQAIHVDRGLLNRALAELAAGSKALYTATAQIRAMRA